MYFYSLISENLINHSLDALISFVRLCCECGSATVPNASNMCVGCIRSKVDISEGIQKQAILQFCKGCERLVFALLLSTKYW